MFVLQGALELIGVVWGPDFALQFTYTLLAILLVCLSLYCLTYYFIHLYIGPNKLWIALAAFYIVSALILVYLVVHQRPFALEFEEGRTNLVFAEEIPFVTLQRTILLLIIPPLLGLVGYVLLIKIVPPTVQRYRLILTATIVFLLFVAAIGLPFIQTRYEAPWRLGLRTLTILVSILLMFTMVPSSPLKDHVGDLIDGWRRNRRIPKGTARDPERSRS